MKQEIISYLKTAASTHVFAIALVAGGLLVGSSWLKEHDARLIADSEVKAAQVQIDGLQKQKADVSKAARVEVVRLQAAAAEVKTAPQAIAAIPEVSTLKVEALPDAPSAVKVDAVELYQNQNKAKQDSTELDACNKKLSLQEQIDGDKDGQIKDLRKKPGFFHRVKSTAITLGIGAAAGYVLTHR